MVDWKLPESTEWFKEQNAHKPTLSYAQEIYEVVKEFPYENALEIGCIWGVSTITILSAGTGHLLSVDPIPQNNPNMHATPEVRHNGFQDRWDHFTGRSEEFWKSNQKTFDLIYIDGSHIYEDIKNDLFEAWKVLTPNGLLIADDFTHQANQTGEYGVSLAFCQLLKESRIEKIHTTTRLFYIYKNENQLLHHQDQS